MELAAPGFRSTLERLDRRSLATLAGVVAMLAGTGAAMSIAATSDVTALAALARGAIVGVPIAVGLHAIARNEQRRFGLLLVGAGAMLLVATLAESGDELAYTVGRATGWLVEILLIYLTLSVPTGRLPGRTDRVLVGVAAVGVAILFLPRLALAAHFEVPSPYTSCTEHCPSNFLFALDHQAALVNGLLRPAGALLMVALAAAVVLRLRERLREATPLARHMFAAVLLVGIARMILFGLGFAVRHADPDAWPVQILAWSLALSAPALAIAFVVAATRWRLDAGAALERLAKRVREVPDSAALAGALGDACGDPKLRIALAEKGSIDQARLAPGRGRTVSEVRDRDTVVAAVIHDEALCATPRLLDAALGVAGVVLANQRLAAEADRARREAERSRSRIAASAERERRRIERDLHDGAQQRLVALRIELELAEELVEEDPKRGIGRLRELEEDLDDALDELRGLAHGVYPPLLADRGLEEALNTVAARSAIPVEVVVRAVGRHEPEVESAIYFCVMEALQNVHKHAARAARVSVSLDRGPDGDLRFSVRDESPDAPGGEFVQGAGITNMRDRLAAVGGYLSITSLRGVGTVVRGRVPASA